MVIHIGSPFMKNFEDFFTVSSGNPFVNIDTAKISMIYLYKHSLRKAGEKAPFEN